MFLLRCAVLFACLVFSAATPAPAAETETPFREDSGLTKAEYLLSAGQFSAALDTVNDVLQRHPENADAYTYRGYAYYRLGEVAKAAKSFRTALTLDPAHLGANKYLADMYLAAGDVARALEQLQVIRMTCGLTDCEELRTLEREIDQHRNDGPAEKKNKD
jgi:Flp pilus assembly protein TadD